MLLKVFFGFKNCYSYYYERIKFGHLFILIADGKTDWIIQVIDQSKFEKPDLKH